MRNDRTETYTTRCSTDPLHREDFKRSLAQFLANWDVDIQAPIQAVGADWFESISSADVLILTTDS
jgi:hypothetical protein